MTGLELLRAIAGGRLPRAPISATLDFDIVGADEGRAEFHGRVSPAHANPMGQVDGGYACTLLDSAMGSSVMSTLPEGASYATAQLSIAHGTTTCVIIEGRG